jgi:hypothetical protein
MHSIPRKQLPTTSWVASKLKEIALGVRRQNKRAVSLAKRLAHGFLAQDKPERHDTDATLAQCSGEWMQARGLVPCIQDTTELDFNG